VSRMISSQICSRVGRSPRHRFLRGLLVVVVSVAAACVLGVLVFLGFSPPRLPAFEVIRSEFAASEGLLLDRHGRIIHEMRVDPRMRRLQWVSLEEISPALRSAILQAEDRRFYSHQGVDWRSVVGAMLASARFTGQRGASTITMQVAAQINRALEPRGGRRSLYQKLLQARAALTLERSWTKSQILEAYLNFVTFRGELQGVAAAATGMFDRRPHGLDQGQSLVLAALIRAPNAGIPEVTARARILAVGLGWAGEVGDVENYVREALQRRYPIRPEASLAPHVALQLLRAPAAEKAARRGEIVTTLDSDLQRSALQSLRHHILAVASQNVRDGALLAVENQTGDVLAYVGNPGDFSSARFVDGVRAPRQAGSTLKPFLYGVAFDRHILTPSSLIDDSALDIPVPGGVYRPRNYDDEFRGLVTARTALASSLNVPAVKTLNLVGVDSLVDTLGRLGFEGLRSPDFYGPSLALGSADVTLWDLVNAYRTLANGGIWGNLRLVFGKESTERRRVLSPAAAFLLSDILSDRESRSRTFSLESPLSTRFWTAVKTGTSKDMRDNWCVGYSDRYTVGVWVGNFSGEPMWNVSGVTGAAPVWLDVMNWLHRWSVSVPPEPPAGLVSRTVELADFGRVRKEWFLRGTESAVVSAAAVHARSRISYPAAGTVIALDPDIPAVSQKVFFEAEPGGRDLVWLLDGEPAGSADSLLLWSPLKGRHRLTLVDRAERILDSVEFEVRGNPGPMIEQ
jgi:penicillin-binding protein 1C